MTINELINKMKSGERFNINIDISDIDILALDLLSLLYERLGDNATYADAERVLSEAIWWHITVNTLIE